MLGTIANWCSVAGIPLALLALTATYIQVHKSRREAFAARERSAWGDMVKFINIRAGEGVAIAPFKSMPFLPRVGELLTLPEEPSGLKCGDYRVVDIHYICFVNEDSEDAELLNVRIEVEPLRDV
jgi:hypothetical protein